MALLNQKRQVTPLIADEDLELIESYFSGQDIRITSSTFLPFTCLGHLFEIIRRRLTFARLAW